MTIKLNESYTLSVNNKTIEVTREELKELYKDLHNLFEKVSVNPGLTNPYPNYGPLHRVICDGDSPVFGK